MVSGLERLQATTHPYEGLAEPASPGVVPSGRSGCGSMPTSSLIRPIFNADSLAQARDRLSEAMRGLRVFTVKAGTGGASCRSAAHWRSPACPRYTSGMPAISHSLGGL